MKNLKTLLFLVVAMLLIVPSVYAQDEMEGMSEEDQAKMWEEYAKMMSPGEHHERLDYFVGEWDALTQMWMSGPDEEPMVSEGTITYEWILDGRFLKEKIDAQGMAPEERYHGLGFLGYDTFRKQYTASGMSNMSTAIYTSAGVYDPDANAYIWYGSMDEPMTGEIGRMTWAIYKIKDDNSFTIEMHDSALGLDGTRVMEVTCTRKMDEE